MKKLCLLLFLCTSLLAFGQEKQNFTVDDFIGAIQKTKDSGDTMKMVFWLPTEFWEVVNSSEPDYDTVGVRYIEDLVKDYIILAAVDGFFDAEGSQFQSEAEMRKTIRIIDKHNNVHAPLSEIEVPKALTHVISSMKPLFANMLGDLGRGFNFYYFQVRDAHNKALIEARQKGAFTVRLNNSDFQWSLPLSVYGPRLYCPVDKEKMNAEWSYCPFHGNKLQTQASN